MNVDEASAVTVTQLNKWTERVYFSI